VLMIKKLTLNRGGGRENNFEDGEGEELRVCHHYQFTRFSYAPTNEGNGTPVRYTWTRWQKKISQEGDIAKRKRVRSL